MVLFGNALAVMLLVTSGQLRPTAVSSARLQLRRRYSTVAEQGFPGFETVNWRGLVATARAHTPDAVIARLNAEALNAPFPFTKSQFHKRCETASSIHPPSTLRNRCCIRCCISSWYCWRA